MSLPFGLDGTRSLSESMAISLPITTFLSLQSWLFVLPRRVCYDLQTFLRLNLQVTSIDFHDWLIFAFVRSRGLKWTIDPCPAYCIVNTNNVLIVQSDLFDIFKRLSLLFNPSISIRF